MRRTGGQGRMLCWISWIKDTDGPYGSLGSVFSLLVEVGKRWSYFQVDWGHLCSIHKGRSDSLPVLVSLEASLEAWDSPMGASNECWPRERSGSTAVVS